MNSVSSFKPATFAVILNKAGKVTATAGKNAMLLNQLTVEGVKAMARDGKGTMGKQASAHVFKGVKGLPEYRTQAAIDGGDWPNVLPLLVAEYGAACFNRSSMRGKRGLVDYLALVEASLIVAFNQAETVKAQQGAMKRLEAVRADIDCANQWVESAEIARLEALAGMTTEETEATEATEATEETEATEA